MATIYRKKGVADGRLWMAQVRVKPFAAVSRAFATRTEAREWAERHERALKDQRQRNPSPPAELPRLTLSGLVEQYLLDPEVQQLRTYEGTAKLLGWWVEHYGSTRILSLGPVTLREARDRLRPGRAPATVNRHLAAMRACWNWGRASDLMPRELLWPSRLMLREPTGRVRFLDGHELRRLLEALDHASPTMRAAVLVSLGCGIRQSELRRLRWADVDFERRALRVRLSKNNEARSVHLPSSVADALVALRQQAIVGSTVICDERGQAVSKPWIEYRWRAIRSAARLIDFRWHDLRHSCASFLAQNGASLLEIGAVLGHRSPSATRRYAHLAEGAKVTGHDALDESLRRAPRQ